MGLLGSDIVVDRYCNGPSGLLDAEAEAPGPREDVGREPGTGLDPPPAPLGESVLCARFRVVAEPEDVAAVQLHPVIRHPASSVQSFIHRRNATVAGGGQA